MHMRVSKERLVKKKMISIKMLTKSINNNVHLSLSAGISDRMCCCFFFFCWLNKRSPLLLYVFICSFWFFTSNSLYSVAIMKRRVNAHVVAVLKEIFLFFFFFFMLFFFLFPLFMQETKCNTTAMCYVFEL